MYLFADHVRGSQQQHQYRIAGCTIVSDKCFPSLAAFKDSTSDPTLPSSGRMTIEPSEPVCLTYDGQGWLGQRWRSVKCTYDASGYTIYVDRIGRFIVAADGSTFGCIERAPESDPNELEEALLGPALILALALQGTWSLHASAISHYDGCIAFVGESGAGKSTLALSLAEHSSFTHVADDILPITATLGGIDALPHFLQLKLPPHRQPSIGLPERIQLRAVYVLDSHAQIPSIEPMAAQAATLTLIRHTVASQLFAPALLASHFSFAADTATRIPVRRLGYPHDRSMLPAVHQLLTRELQALS